MRTAVAMFWCALIVTAVDGCAPAREVVERAEVNDKTPVDVQVVGIGRLSERGDYFGSIEPRSATTVSSEVPGKILDVRVVEGQQVKEGEVLVVLDEEPYRLAEEQAKQVLASARLRVSQIEESLQIQRRTLQANVDSATAMVEMAKARLSLVEKGARYEERRQMASALELAQISKENASVEYGRVKALFDANAATQQMLDGARANAEAAEARYSQAYEAKRMVNNGARVEDKEAARAQVKQAEAGLAAASSALDSLKVQEKELEAAKIQARTAEIGLEAAQLNRSKTQIKSLVKGVAVVSVKYVDRGEMASPGVPLLELLEMSSPQVVMRVPPLEVGYLHEKDPVKVKCMGDEDGKSRDGVIEYVSIQANPQNTTYAVKITLQNPDGRLRAGQICEANPNLETFALPLLPRDAVLDTMEGKAVMVLGDDGKVRERPVKLAAERDGLAAVSEGLAEGEKVLVVGQRLVKDGDPVNVRQERPAVVPVQDSL